MEVELRIYKDLNTLRTNTVKNSVYFVLNATTQKVSEIWVTDKNNTPKPVELTGGIVASIQNTDGNLTITGTDSKIINLSSAIVSLINSALQSGGNVSELVNDANYITLADVPTFIPSDYDLEDFTNTGVDPFVHVSEIESFVPYTGAEEDVDLGEFQLKAGQIELDQTPTGTFSTAKIRWNDTAGTAEIRLKGNNVTLQLGQELVKRVVNKTVTNITLQESNYQAVKIVGATGQRLSVDLAQANLEANSSTTLGLVTESISNNQEGFITFSGEVNSINTTGSLQGETWVDGDILYLSSSVAGQLTKVAPTAPNHTIKVGYVQYAHAIQGKIHVDVDTGYSLNNLHNVAITGTTTNKVLGSVTEGLWENKTIGDILGYEPTSVDDLKIDTGANPSITTVDFGGIPAGTDIQNLTFNSILIDAMIAYLYPQFTAKACNYPSTVEVGTTISGSYTFTWAISNGTNIVPNSVNIFDVNANDYLVTGLADDGSQTVTLNSQLLNTNNATQVWQISAENTKSEVVESGNITTTAIYPIFYGVANSQPTANQSLIDGGTKAIVSSTGTLNITFGASGQYLWFAHPSINTTKTKWYVNALNNGNIGSISDLFNAPTTVSITTVMWAGVSYKIYISNIPTTTSGNMELKNS